MSADRFRSRTKSQRRAAARGQAQRSAKRPGWLLWAGAAAVAATAIGVYAIVRPGASDGTGDVGAPASNATVGTGADGELSQIKTNDYHSMAVSPIDPNVVLYGHHGGVLRSTDGGRTWNNTELNGPADDAMGMAFAGPGGNTVFAAGHDVFFRSDDGGSSWKPMKADLPATDIHGFAVAPDDANRLYANVVRFGLFRSDDGGKTWAIAGAALPGDIMTLGAGPGGQLYAAGMQGSILRSDDGGKSFKATGKPPGSLAMTVMASGTREVVYAGAQGAVLFSKDGGNSWEERPVPGGGQVMMGAVNPSNPMDVAIVAVRAGVGHVFRSADGGATWGPG